VTRPAGAPGRPQALDWLLGGAVLAVGFTLCRRSLVLSDEGYLLLQSLDLAHGKILYRDMDSFVAPGVWLLLAALFRVFEPSVLVSRLAALACFAASVFVAARCVERLSGRASARAAVAGFLVFSVWAFPAWTWSFYSPWSILFALAALERLLAWRERERARDLVWTGAWLGLSLLFKQNYGAQAALGAGLAAAAIRLEAGTPLRALPGALAAAGLRVAAGAALVVAPVAGWLAAAGALDDAFRALVLHPFGGFLGQHDIAYLPPSELFRRDLMAGQGRLTYGAFALTNAALRFDWPFALVRGVEGLHVLLYWLPPLCFGAGAVLALRPQRPGARLDGGLAAALALTGMLFLGVFPRADFNHLMNVYQPVLVAAPVVAQRLLSRRGRLPAGPRRAALSLAALLACLYAGVAAYWYVDLLRSLDEPLPGPRSGVKLARESSQMLEFEVNAIRASTRPGEPVLTLPGLAMLNFLAERPMPGRYYNFYAVHIAHDAGAGVVEDMERAGVRLVVADYHDFFSERARLRQYAPLLTRHLRRHFAPAFSVALDEHLFLRRRPRPLPELEIQSALSDCDVGPPDWRARSVRDHLLFDTLYHPLQWGEEPPRREVSTLCRASLPEGGRLALALGYRQPSVVEPGTLLRGEVWVFPAEAGAAAPELVLAEEIAPVAATGWASPPPVERRVDLSRWGGRTVLLLFRSLYRGEARVQTLDFKGFAMAWQDVVIEAAPSRR
jgi:hypothetical protein